MVEPIPVLKQSPPKNHHEELCILIPASPLQSPPPTAIFLRSKQNNTFYNIIDRCIYHLHNILLFEYLSLYFPIYCTILTFNRVIVKSPHPLVDSIMCNSINLSDHSFFDKSFSTHKTQLTLFKYKARAETIDEICCKSCAKPSYRH